MRNSAGVEMAQQPPAGAWGTYSKRGPGKAVRLPAAADTHSQQARVSGEGIDIRATVGSKGAPRRTRVAFTNGNPAVVVVARWRHVCASCGFYSHNDAPAERHASKTGHSMLGGQTDASS